MKYPLTLLIIAAVGCENKNYTTAKMVTNTVAVKQKIQIPAAIATHPDDGKPYFAFMLSKNGHTTINTVSDKPVFTVVENEMTILLDPSHHLLTNGDLIYSKANYKTLYPHNNLS